MTVLTSARPINYAPFSVLPAISNWLSSRQIISALRKKPGAAILWQYVPHMYGRGGMNWAIVQATATARQEGHTQLLLAHEIAAPLSAWPHRLVYTLVQLCAWRRLVSSADAVGISTEAWLLAWRERAPKAAAKFELCPSPSSIPFHPASAAEIAQWRARLEFPAGTRIAGFFGDPSRPKQVEWLYQLQRELNQPDRATGLAFIGSGSGKPVHESPFVRHLGFISPRDVSLALQSLDLLCLPFVDGVSERRTSFMAGLSHGCGVVTTIGPSTGPTLRAADWFVRSDADNPGEFRRAADTLLRQEETRQQLGRRAREVYQQEYDWARVSHWVETAVENSARAKTS